VSRASLRVRTLSALVCALLVSVGYRWLQPRATDLHAPPGAGDAVSSLCACAVVLAWVAFSCGVATTWRRRLASVAVLSPLLTAYLVAWDYFEVDPNGMIGHDVWFGDAFYWEMTSILLAALFVLGLLAVSCGRGVEWLIQRLARRSSG
jgi:hypothetical protein